MTERDLGGERDPAELEEAPPVSEIPEAWRPHQDTIGAIQGQPDARRDMGPDVASTRDVAEVDDARLDTAAERIKQVEELQPERWAQLDDDGKAAALNRAGQELAQVYNHPQPPLVVKDMQEPSALGEYGDGFSFNRRTGKVEGADYGIRMNKEAQTDLLGDDPAAALNTYAHEFRHSYQDEQVTAREKPQFRNLVDDPDEAAEWAANSANYIGPEEDFDAYHNQPVERDARAFAEGLVRRVYR